MDPMVPLLLLAFAAGHVVIVTLVAGTPVWTARFWTQLAAVPAAQALVVGWLHSRKRASRESGAPRAISGGSDS